MQTRNIRQSCVVTKINEMPTGYIGQSLQTHNLSLRTSEKFVLNELEVFKEQYSPNAGLKFANLALFQQQNVFKRSIYNASTFCLESIVIFLEQYEMTLNSDGETKGGQWGGVVMTTFAGSLVILSNLKGDVQLFQVFQSFICCTSYGWILKWKLRQIRNLKQCSPYCYSLIHLTYH